MIKIIGIFELICGELAQLGERLLCTQEVSGSIPLFSTSKARYKPLREGLYLALEEPKLFKIVMLRV